MLNPLLKGLENYKIFKDLIENIEEKNNKICVNGVTDSAKPHLIYSLYNSSGILPLVVCPNVSSAKKILQDLKFYSNICIEYFPAREVTYYTFDSQSRELENARVSVISKLVNKEKCIIVTTVEALLQKMMPKDTYKDLGIYLKQGEKFPLEKLIDTCIKMGYARVDLVEGPGQFSVRGGLIDIFTAQNNEAVRVEFFGNEIDNIRTFDIETQRSKKTLTEFSISFSNEFVISEIRKQQVLEKLKNTVEQQKLNHELLDNIKQDIERIEAGLINSVMDKYFELVVPENVTLLDYLEDRYCVYFDEYSKLDTRCENITFENEETLRLMTEKYEIYPEFAFKINSLDYIISMSDKLPIVNLEKLNDDTKRRTFKRHYTISSREAVFYKNISDVIIADIKRYKAENKKIVLVFATIAKIEGVKNLLQDEGISCKYVQDITMVDKLVPGNIYITQGILSSGFVYEDFELVVISEQISGIKNKSSKSSKEFLGDAINSYSDLKVGDYVVHTDHGIGQYLGIHQVEVNYTIKDYIKIMYQDNGIIYVPIANLDSIKKYACEEGFIPKLNKLGTKTWRETKEKLNKHVKNIAKELVALYAKRKVAEGYAFSKDTPWQSEFEQDVEFELTEDQERCIKELKADMESSKPMDRLLCGDVGYGKTEVAIRGAFKAVMDAKQVAYLVPTTVLCLQQFKVFKSRMESYGINVEMLSRFKTQKEQREILKKLESGEIDIIVGTHRLLSKDINFKDLGFLIIDEEHRFGVKDKEEIKKYRNNVDVLSMTATPIPRTLHMSMIGVRDISVILEPPKERMPVHTYVLEYSNEVIREGIEKELDREGQVFYLSNRVNNIEEVSSKVRSMVPQARVAIAHGRMTPENIEEVMISFMEHKIDILVCTSILESGIDIPNANTIIVENADRLGLAQLYQIRGRVGRSNRLSYAYITYNKERALTEEADKRLKAIKDFTEFGSGFKIALRDLEIRGAGNLLGSEQSGHMLSVGYDMYVSLLEKAVEQEKLNLDSGKNTNKDRLEKDLLEMKEVKISIDISANIPDEYISDSVIKMEMYQKLSNAVNDELVQDIIDELIDRFGNVPKETQNLIDIIKIRNMCRDLGINEVKVQEEYVAFMSKNVKNNIKYRLTNNSKRDILCAIEVALINLKKIVNAKQK